MKKRSSPRKPLPAAPRSPRTEPFEIGGEKVPPGSRRRIEIPVAPLFNQIPLSLMPVVVHGIRPGPRLWVSGAIHGDELIGPIIIKEVLSRVEPERLSGTLVAVPAVNVFGVLHQSRYLPDRRDLNRTFPGSRQGSLAARLARLFMTEIARRCTHGIDLHTAAIHRSNLPQIRANLKDPETRRCALAFGAPVVLHSEERDGSLRQAASRRGIATLLYEAGEALRHDPEAVRVGSRGVLGVMAALGMVEGVAPGGGRPLESIETHWVRAAGSGYLVLEVRLGERVGRGQRLGTLHTHIHADFADVTELPVIAPVGGVVIGRLENPIVSVGDALVHIAVPGKTPRSPSPSAGLEWPT